MELSSFLTCGQLVFRVHLFTEALLHAKKLLGTRKYLRPRPGLEGLGIEEANRKEGGPHTTDWKVALKWNIPEEVAGTL